MDIYANGQKNKQHSLRFIHIKAANVVGILNRIASLMRRRRYNMEEVSVSFDNEGIAHMIIAIDGELFDIEQVVHQVAKLHDVIDVYDATYKKDKLFHAIYVQASKKKIFETFPESPIKIVENDEGGVTGVFTVNVENKDSFIRFLTEHGFLYVRRILSLI